MLLLVIPEMIDVVGLQPSLDSMSLTVSLWKSHCFHRKAIEWLATRFHACA
jgi:hypothetical protein